MKKRRICFITGTRADWGLLTPLAQALRARPDAEVCVVATNMHLMEQYGMTVNEIRVAGFEPDACIPLGNTVQTEAQVARAMGTLTAGLAEFLERRPVDMAVILGDRFEALAAASACAVMRVPIVHIAGGTVSEGAVDDALRHAVTKLSALHLVETELCRRRVIQMGEDPARVVTTGAIGLQNVLSRPMDAQQLAESLDGFQVDRDTLLVTLHPATLDTTMPPSRQWDELAETLDWWHGHTGGRVLVTGSNNDAGGAEISACAQAWCAERAPWARFVPSLGMRRYVSALHCVHAVVGNSSSGLVEVPSTGRCTVNIGHRQDGRECGRSVIHCAHRTAKIVDALKLTLTPEGRALAASPNPYFQPNTVQLMVDAIMGLNLDTALNKKFYSLQ